MNVARCTWDDNVEGRSGVAPGPAAGTVAKGMRREGLKVARCTLHVGRQRGGAQRRCARTGSGGSGEGMRLEGGGRRGDVGAQRRCARTGSGDSGEGDEARGVEGCTLHVARGTTTWRGAAALRPDRQRGQWRGDEARGDEARGERRARREARGDEARGERREARSEKREARGERGARGTLL